MKVTVGWRKDEVELSTALCPTYDGERGIAEDARGLAEECARAIGKLAALLVEKHVLSLEEAADACGAWNLNEVKE